MNEHDRRKRIQRLREALGDHSDILVDLEVLPGGLVRCIDITEEGVTESVATLCLPEEEPDGYP